MKASENPRNAIYEEIKRLRDNSICQAEMWMRVAREQAEADAPFTGFLILAADEQKTVAAYTALLEMS